jgi:hypothetical protein
MIGKFEVIHVDFKYLISAMGETREQAQALITDYLEENNIKALDYFNFDLVITKAGKKNTLFIAYAATKEKMSGNKFIQSVSLTNDTFLKITCPIEDYDDLIEGKYKDQYEAYIKSQNLKINYSKIFGLIKALDDHYEILFNCK